MKTPLNNIYVTSRASGVVDSYGRVTIKKLLTYDLVSDPGFTNAKMYLRDLDDDFETQNYEEWYEE